MLAAGERRYLNRRGTLPYQEEMGPILPGGEDPTLPGGEGSYPTRRGTLPYQKEKDPTLPGAEGPF